MKTMKTMKRQRRMGSIWVFFAMVFAFSLVMTGITFARGPKEICWAIDTERCDTPTGDCRFKDDDDDCVHCTSAAPLSSACVWHPTSFCQITGSATPVDCGKRRSGFCLLGQCLGNIPAGACLVWECTNPVGAEQ